MNAITHNFRPDTAATDRPLVRVVIVGSVDHGKSTLIGRLLYETGSLPDGKLDQLKFVSARRGIPFEWSFLLDALQTERDQGITIDTSQVRLRTQAKDFVLIDAPGHIEFLRNMITGASQADGAILLIDAAEGVREQTRRHGYLLHLLGLRQVIVVINKMDRISYDATRFRKIEEEITAYLGSLEIVPQAVIPVSARDGNGITEHTFTSEWYRPTVLRALQGIVPPPAATEQALRFPVQAVYKFDDRRIIAGRIVSGSIAIGDEIVAMPSQRKARVKSIEAWPAKADATAKLRAEAGQSVGITLDRELFIERGNVIAAPENPGRIGRRIRTRVFWLHSEPLKAGSKVNVRIGTAETPGRITAIEHALDPGDMTSTRKENLGQNNVGELTIDLAAPLAAEVYADNTAQGRIVLDFEGRIAGGGLILAVEDGAAAPASSSAGDLQAEAGRLNIILANLSAAERLARIREEIGGAITFTTSFGLEDQVILHLIADGNLDIDVVTLDTGRLFNETYDVWAESELRYGRGIRAVAPTADDLEQLVAQQGVNGFYRSVEARHACCRVRKVKPLDRALAGSRAWITGLRNGQSDERRAVPLVEADTTRGLLKINPLIDWGRESAVQFVAANSVPVNALHAKGFPSIGCAPCTRAIAPGEPERAGRWWWEQNEKRECGLHARGS